MADRTYRIVDRVARDATYTDSGAPAYRYVTDTVIYIRQAGDVVQTPVIAEVTVSVAEPSGTPVTQSTWTYLVAIRDGVARAARLRKSSPSISRAYTRDIPATFAWVAIGDYPALTLATTEPGVPHVTLTDAAAVDADPADLPVELQI